MKSEMIFKICSCILLLVFPLSDAKILKFPKEIEKCKADDNECIKDRFNTIMHKFGKTGYPEIGLTSIEPYNLPDIIYGEDSKATFGVKFNMTNVRVYDLSTSDVLNVTGFSDKLEDSSVYIQFLTPKLIMKCDCKMFGKILSIPLNVEGPMEIHLTNSSLALRFKLGTKTVDGEKVAVVNKYKHLHKVDKLTLNMDISKSFKGDNAIGENINQILNDNWKELWQEVQKITVAPVVNRMIESLNEILEVFPYDILFLKND